MGERPASLEALCAARVAVGLAELLGRRDGGAAEAAAEEEEEGVLAFLHSLSLSEEATQVMLRTCMRAAVLRPTLLVHLLEPNGASVKALDFSEYQPPPRACEVDGAGEGGGEETKGAVGGELKDFCDVWRLCPNLETLIINHQDLGRSSRRPLRQLLFHAALATVTTPQRQLQQEQQHMGLHMSPPPPQGHTLHSLNLSGCSGVNLTMVRAIVSGAINLRELDLGYVDELTSQCGRVLAHAAEGSAWSHTLRKLCLARAEGIERSDLQRMCNSLHNLTSLVLKSCAGPFVLQLPASLQELDLGFVHPALDCFAIRNMMRSTLASLRVLCLEESDISDEEFLEAVGSVDGPLPLEQLAISWCAELSTSTLQVLLEKCEPGRLTHLRLQNTEVDDDIIRHTICPRAHNLVELNLGRVQSASGDVLCLLAAAAPNLQVLDIAWSTATDESVMAFLVQCTNLRELLLQGCKEVHCMTMSALGDDPSLAARLELLDLSFVNDISGDAAKTLSIRRPTLRVVDYFRERWFQGEVEEEFH